MRYLVALLLLSIASACTHSNASAVALRNAGADRTVVLELFTSEGCSSCPPADDLLRTLVATQPVPGARIIALSEHVEYWNYLGWRDRFSAAAFTTRQADYQAKVFRASAVYTPQAVIDGNIECIGSDKGAVRRAVERAMQAEKADVQLNVDAASPRQWTATIDIHVPPSMPRTEPADVVVAVIENGLVTDVRRGENRGRTLAHDSVVRDLRVVDTLDVHEDARSLSTAVRIGDDWNVNRLEVVAFVQERSRRTIIGAASIKTPGRISIDGNHASQRRES